MNGARALAVRHRTLLIPAVVTLAVLADRIQVPLSTGGRGALSLLELIAPVLAVATVLVYGLTRSLRFVRNPVFLLGVLPYIALSGLLPFLGAIFYGYPVRTLYSATDFTTALSFLIIGAALFDRDERDWVPWIFTAIVVQFVYALGQALYLARGPGFELFTPFHDWDLSLETLNGVLVQARSSGLYFNPNELGLWSGMALIIAWSILPSRMRVLGVLLAAGTLLLSQSRGATVALVVAAAVALTLAFALGHVSPARFARGAISLVVVLGIIIAAVVVIGLPTAEIQRFSSLLAVLSQGPQADANLAGRLDYWQAVTALNAFYPWGTWGPPELLLGTAVDSSWFQAFAQGSVPYAAALGLLLVSTAALARSRYRLVLFVLAVFIAVAGLTQTPFGYPPIILFWVLLGTALQQSLKAPVRATPLPRDRWQTSRPRRRPGERAVGGESTG
jgi:O-antigen ligase